MLVLSSLCWALRYTFGYDEAQKKVWDVRLHIDDLDSEVLPFFPNTYWREHLVGFFGGVIKYEKYLFLNVFCMTSILTQNLSVG